MSMLAGPARPPRGENDVAFMAAAILAGAVSVGLFALAIFSAAV